MKVVGYITTALLCFTAAFAAVPSDSETDSLSKRQGTRPNTNQREFIFSAGLSSDEPLYGRTLTANGNRFWMGKSIKGRCLPPGAKSYGPCRTSGTAQTVFLPFKRVSEAGLFGSLNLASTRDAVEGFDGQRVYVNPGDGALAFETSKNPAPSDAYFNFQSSFGGITLDFDDVPKNGSGLIYLCPGESAEVMQAFVDVGQRIPKRCKGQSFYSRLTSEVFSYR